MIQEESTQKTVALIIRASRLSENVLKKAIMMYLEQQKNKPERHGKISVRKLMEQDQGANTMEINNSNIRAFDRVASKYNVDYAVQKDKSSINPKYIIYFKGRDMDVISRAFRDFCDLNEKNHSRPSLVKKLEHLKGMEKNRPERERSREKKPDRGEASL